MTVTLRDFPYPYSSLLAICSDLDETPDEATYFEIARFLNTIQDTKLGKGVGLEVGNTLYFDMPKEHFAYWNSNETTRDNLCELMRSGHIDCLHSIGDTAKTRLDVLRVFGELENRKCAIKVWVDHATAPTNLGNDIMKGGGDKLGHPAFHSDLLVNYGIKYVWRGRVTSVIGQGVPPKFRGIANIHHPLMSGKTLAKTFMKQAMAVIIPDGKYSLHHGNGVLKQITLNCGKPVYEFMRSNPHWGGVSSCDTGREVGEVLSKRFLNELVRRRASSILYTHLGKLDRTNGKSAFPPSAVKAFSLLSAFKQGGKVLVATTRRLLDYHRVKSELCWSVQETSGYRTIAIKSADKKDQLQGLTFYIENDKETKVTLNEHSINVVSNLPDETGKCSISIPWEPLAFPI